MTSDRFEQAGLFATLRARASVKEAVHVAGTGAAERSLTARLFESLEFEVLPSRGFDIGDAWFRGTPVSWFSPVRDARALPSPAGTEWLSRFNGGLLTTCGFGTIGSAANGEGLHGIASHLPSDEVSWRVDDDGSVRLEAMVESVALFGPSFRVRRTIECAAINLNVARLEVTDNVTNVGPISAPLNMLYHLNFGAPLVAPGSSVRIDSDRVLASGPHSQVPDWSSLPEPTREITEAIFEHQGISVDSQGFSRAKILSSVSNIGALIEWTAATLPRLHQWVFPTWGRWALGIEPATAPLFGPDRAAPNAGAPMLAPGESQSHTVAISVGSRDAIEQLV